MRRIISMVLSIALAMSLLSIPSFADNSASHPASIGYTSGESRELTLEEIEQMLITYLKDAHPDAISNTASYIDFLLSQLIEETDKELSQAECYDDICLYMSEYVYVYQNLLLETAQNDFFTLPSDLGNLYPSEIREHVAEKDAEFTANYLDAQSSLAVPYATFSSSAAVSYARTWATSRNSNYNSYVSDCTNFVSQCFVAGGIAMKKPSTVSTGLVSSTSYWYSIRYEDWHGNNYVYKWNESSSFVNVSDLATYLINNVAVTITTTPYLSTVQNSAKPGDIVQLKNSGGEWYHSIIITGGSSGNRTYCGHSTNRLDANLSNVSASSYRIIHVN
jgi:hypothetical protein